MKQILLERYGSPEDAVRCREVPDPGAPAAGQVVFDVLAFPINPADLSMCRGTYRLRPTLPAGIGAEAAWSRSRPAGTGITSSPATRRRCVQFSRWRLIARSPGLTCETPPPTAVTR